MRLRVFGPQYLGWARAPQVIWGAGSRQIFKFDF
jgi:hypothetical protein